MNRILIPICIFGVVAGAWLGLMENILRHEGYQSRSVVAALIALQGFATLLFIRSRGRSLYRCVVMTGAAGIIWLGYSSISKMLTAPHFEGFVLIIGAALILQGALTLALLFPANRVSV
jgi:hypothetical protein